MSDKNKEALEAARDKLLARINDGDVSNPGILIGLSAALVKVVEELRALGPDGD